MQDAIILYENGKAIGGEGHPTNASDITFDNADTDLVSENVNDAIVEVNEKTKHGLVELWVNDNPATAVAGGTLATINNVTKTYDMFLIEYAPSTTYKNRSLIGACEKEESAEFLYMSLTTEGKVLENRRIITINQSGTTITVTTSDNTLRTLNAMGTAPASTTSNGGVIPKRILGVLHND